MNSRSLRNIWTFKSKLVLAILLSSPIEKFTVNSIGIFFQNWKLKTKSIVIPEENQNRVLISFFQFEKASKIPVHGQNVVNQYHIDSRFNFASNSFLNKMAQNLIPYLLPNNRLNQFFSITSILYQYQSC